MSENSDKNQESSGVRRIIEDVLTIGFVIIVIIFLYKIISPAIHSSPKENTPLPETTAETSYVDDFDYDFDYDAYVSEMDRSNSSDLVSAMILGNAVLGLGSGNINEELTNNYLSQIEALDKHKFERWTRIMKEWSRVNSMEINYDKLPDNLAKDDSLCLVVLGFQLNSNGSMRQELIKRLELAKACAEQYPNAYVLCTGGPTASKEAAVTEADEMAKWLIENGVSAKRILVENQSLTTAENAEFSNNLIQEFQPQITQVAIITSDYHIPTGELFFETEFILREDTDTPKINVVAHAACHYQTYTLGASFQASGLITIKNYHAN